MLELFLSLSVFTELLSSEGLTLNPVEPSLADGSINTIYGSEPKLDADVPNFLAHMIFLISYLIPLSRFPS